MAKNGKKVATLPVIRESAQNVWLAGLGALAMAGEEGNRLFRQLVKKGESMDRANRAKLGELKHKALDLRHDATAAVGRLTAPVDAGVTTALHRLGVPTRKEILALTKRVEELTRAVEKSRKRNGARKAAAPKPETV